jgi:protein-tyrosine phosphatase
MPAHIYWVDFAGPGRLAVVGRPRSAGVIREMKAAGIDVLVSMLEVEEAIEVGLADEAERCQRAGIEFINASVTDHGTPTSFEQIEALAGRLAGHLAAGRGVGAHCFAGLGRSPLLVASVLIHLGHDDADAIERVSAARGFPVPEMASQHEWLLELARRRGRI